ncbi:hypothetical protein ASC87_21015 [Rhizobacter sp. Root1221]|nr:hypothetical protein ASC87_21015 [Rhizobacter sp. Root1221]
MVKTPRPTGTGKVNIPGATAESIVSDVKSAKARMEQGRIEEEEPSVLTKSAQAAKLACQYAAFALAAHSGPTSTAADVVDLHSGGAAAPVKRENESHTLSSTLGFLAGMTAGETAKTTVNLATQVELPPEIRLDLGELAGEINAGISSVQRTAHERAVEGNLAAKAELVAMVIFPDQQVRVEAAMTALFQRLGVETAVPTTPAALAKPPNLMASQVLCNAAKTAFGQDQEALARAIEGLQGVSRAALGEKISQVTAGPGGLRENGRIEDPVLQLVATLSRVPGGQAMLAKLIPFPAERAAAANATEKADHVEALRVSTAALSALQQARRGGEVDPQQRAFLSEAVAHGTSVLANTLDPAQPATTASIRRHTAFRAVQSGFTSNGPDSAYAKVNSRLADFSEAGMEQTQKRNKRAARSRLGRVKNWFTGALPKAMAGWEGAIPNAVNAMGSQPTVWRKSVMRQLTKAAVSNRMLPSRDEALSGLNRATMDVHQALVQRDGGSTPAEKLMKGVLDALHLGTGEDVTERSLKKLGSAFFNQVESALPNGVDGLEPAELRAAWNSLRDAHPNAGHLLQMLTGHVDVHALLDGTEPAQVHGMSQAARGARSDHVAQKAIASFGTMAAAAGAAAALQPEAGAAAAMASLMKATALVLRDVEPQAALGALRIETFEKIELSLAGDLRRATPEGSPVPSWDEARQRVKDSWPESVRNTWNEKQDSGDDAGRLMRMLVDQTVALIPDQLEAPASATPGAQSVREVFDQAGPLQELQRDMHASRFELAVADTVTLFNDLRSPRDAEAVMTSLSQRVSLGEKFKSADTRQGSVDVGKAVTLALSFQEVISPLLGGGMGTERSMDINMNGASMQLFVGKTATKNFSVGVNAGLRGDLGHDDHEFNLGEDGDEAGIALRFNLRAELGGEWSSTQGVSLRLERKGGHEDQLRREFGDVMTDLAQPQLGAPAPGVEAYPDVLAYMLDRHPKLAVADMSNEKTSKTSEASATANAMLRVKGGIDVGADAPQGELDAAEAEKKRNRKAVGMGVSAGGATKVQREKQSQTEAETRLSVREDKRSEKHKMELRANFLSPVSMLPSDLQSQKPEAILQLRAAQLEVRKQFYNSGVDTTLRHVQRNGETWADQTQMIREYENVNDFLGDLEPRQAQYVSILATKDGIPGAELKEKLGRSWERLSGTLQQAQESAKTSVGANMTHSLVTKLRPEAGEVYDGLEALAQLADEAGDPVKASQHRAEAMALLKSDDAWIANNLQFKTKAKSEKSQTSTFGFGAGKAAGETTRLHEFLPAGAGQVGKSSNKPIAVPRDHSARWTPSLPPPPPPPRSLSEILRATRPENSDDLQANGSEGQTSTENTVVDSTGVQSTITQPLTQVEPVVEVEMDAKVEIRSDDTSTKEEASSSTVVQPTITQPLIQEESVVEVKVDAKAEIRSDDASTDKEASSSTDVQPTITQPLTQVEPVVDVKVDAKVEIRSDDASTKEEASSSTVVQPTITQPLTQEEPVVEVKVDAKVEIRSDDASTDKEASSSTGVQPTITQPLTQEQPVVEVQAEPNVEIRPDAASTAVPVSQPTVAQPTITRRNSI